VCHGIAQVQRGSIEIDSVVGQGTTVRLILPSCSDAAVPESPRDDVPDESAGVSCANVPDLRILYIDDDDDVRNSFSVVARTCGWRVDLAEDGQAGLNLLKSTPYDVVITDFGMRGMSGKEVTQLAKKMRSDVAVIVISGWDESVVRQAFDGQDAKPDFLISKPATLECLEAALGTVQCRVERKENNYAS
jgi:CheY-like chemotaxis protein